VYVCQPEWSIAGLAGTSRINYPDFRPSASLSDRSYTPTHPREKWTETNGWTYSSTAPNAFMECEGDNFTFTFT